MDNYIKDDHKFYLTLRQNQFVLIERSFDGQQDKIAGSVVDLGDKWVVFLETEMIPVLLGETGTKTEALALLWNNRHLA